MSEVDEISRKSKFRQSKLIQFPGRSVSASLDQSPSELSMLYQDHLIDNRLNVAKQSTINIKYKEQWYKAINATLDWNSNRCFISLKICWILLYMMLLVINLLLFPYCIGFSALEGIEYLILHYFAISIINLSIKVAINLQNKYSVRNLRTIIYKELFCLIVITIFILSWDEISFTVLLILIQQIQQLNSAGNNIQSLILIQINNQYQLLNATLIKLWLLTAWMAYTLACYWHVYICDDNSCLDIYLSGRQEQFKFCLKFILTQDFDNPLINDSNQLLLPLLTKLYSYFLVALIAYTLFLCLSDRQEIQVKNTEVLQKLGEAHINRYEELHLLDLLGMGIPPKMVSNLCDFQILQNIPCFREYSDLSIKQIQKYSQQLRCQPGTIIRELGIYYLIAGQSAIKYGNTISNCQLRQLNPGDVYGEVWFCTNQNQGVYIECMSECIILCWKQEDILNALTTRDKELYYKLKDNIIFTNNTAMINARCEFCQDFHQISQCPILNHRLPASQFIEQCSYKQQREYFKRTITKPSWNIFIAQKKKPEVYIQLHSNPEQLSSYNDQSMSQLESYMTSYVQSSKQITLQLPTIVDSNEVISNDNYHNKDQQIPTRRLPLSDIEPLKHIEISMTQRQYSIIYDHYKNYLHFNPEYNITNIAKIVNKHR